MGFKEGFLWGAATAAPQIEGAAFEDGKGRSLWDDFCEQPGKVFGGHKLDPACDHYHFYREDVALLKALGIPNYRFSVSWPRLLPQGSGQVNPKGLDFYNRLIDSLLENGIRPFMTLFHWDYPSALEDRGGWHNPDSPKWFSDYAALIAQSFGDRVKDYIPLNEPQCFIGLGYSLGAHAPGLKLGPRVVAPMSHRVLLASGLANRALRQLVPGCRIGYAPCGDPMIPASAAPEDIEAARRAYFDVSDDRESWPMSVSWWSDPVVLGRYPQKGLDLYGQYLPAHWERDMDTLRQKLDFYGQNIYNGVRVRARGDGYERLPWPEGTPKADITGWYVSPDALYWGPKFLYERYHLPIIITENGISCHDAVSLDGQVHDPNRQDYLNRYLLSYRRAADEGVDLEGYFVWSLLDNFEWAMGYHHRFGLVYVDYQTQKRTIKDSAWWYKKVIETGGANL